MSDHASMTQEIRAQARKWLESGEVKYFVGYEQGANSNVARPFFANKAEDANKLVWSTTCVNNLTRFLVDEMKTKAKRGEELDKTPIGIVVKPCDSKTIIELMKENIVPRDRVKIIGVTCQGILDTKRLGDETAPSLDNDNIADKCQVCSHHNPVIADVVVGEQVEEACETGYDDVDELANMTQEERWAFWERQFSRCVRCYACREACPLCYCEECVFDKFKPYKWNERTTGEKENTFYHLVRGMHLAGRCIDCGECERVCPVDIPIRKINRFLEKNSKERFKISAGENPDDESVFGTYDIGDPGEDIW